MVAGAQGFAHNKKKTVNFHRIDRLGRYGRQKLIPRDLSQTRLQVPKSIEKWHF